MDFDGRELRFGGEVIEVREEGDEFILEALAHRTGGRTEIFDFTEEIDPGAFRAAIPKSDIVLNVNHGRSSGVLARTTSGTMKVFESDEGLGFRARLGRSDPESLSLMSKVQRGDLASLSFAFQLKREGQTWSEADKANPLPHRQIHKVERLFDVSLGERPAFPGTEVTLARDREASRGAFLSRNIDQAETDLRRSQLYDAALRGGPRS